jgi:hypothetical protein
MNPAGRKAELKTATDRALDRLEVEIRALSRELKAYLRSQQLASGRRK